MSSPAHAASVALRDFRTDVVSLWIERSHRNAQSLWRIPYNNGLRLQLEIAGGMKMQRVPIHMYGLSPTLGLAAEDKSVPEANSPRNFG
jgi:hypothetical protein